MKVHYRAFLFGLFAVVSMTTGGACCNNPCWGWRFHPCASCSPACSSPVSAPVVYRPPTIVSSGSDCPGCGGGMVTQQLAGYPAPGGFPPPGYAPIIGNPMPLPGSTLVPGHDSVVPSPMPGK